MIHITGIRLSRDGVEIETGGYWYALARTNLRLGDDVITYRNLERAVNDQRCARCKTPLGNVSPGFSRTALGFVCAHCLKPGEEIARARSLE